MGRWHWPLAGFVHDVWAELTRDLEESVFGTFYRWLRPKGRHRGQA